MFDDRDDRRPNDIDPERRTREEMIRYLRDYKGLVRSYVEQVEEASPEVFTRVEDYADTMDRLLVNAEKEYREGGDMSELISKYVPVMNRIRHRMKKKASFDVEEVDQNFWEERCIDEMLREMETRKTRLRKIADKNDRGNVRNRDHRGGTDTIYEDLRQLNSQYQNEFAMMRLLSQRLDYADKAVKNFDEIIGGVFNPEETREPGITEEDIREEVEMEGWDEELIEEWSGDIR